MAHKYNARKTAIDGITFDSLKEAGRYQELKLAERAGIIEGLTLKPRFTLQPGFSDNQGNRIRAITYTADFQYMENGRSVVEDVKGFETKTWNIKKKIFLYLYPEHILRIT